MIKSLQIYTNTLRNIVIFATNFLKTKENENQTFTIWI